MRAEKAVAALLNAAPGVSAIVGAKIYGAAAPDETPAPLLVYRKVSAERPDQLQPSPIQLVEAQVEVLCVASTYPELKALGEAVRLALVGQAGIVNGVELQYISIEEEGADEYEPQLREFAQPWTFRVQHTE
jgi:hypothetical protein